MKAGAVTTAGRGPEQEQGHDGGPLRCEFLQSLLLGRDNLCAKIHTTPVSLSKILGRKWDAEKTLLETKLKMVFQWKEQLK